MDMQKINTEVGTMLEYLATKELTPDEKLATLRSAACTIEQVLLAESFHASILRMLTR